jgi:membrane protein implicated in regulation of membrane protease activity
VKEFLVYTALRLAMFLVAFAVVVGIWSIPTDGSLTYNDVFWTFVIAFAVSGVASYFLLDPFRERFARKVQARAERATARFEERRSKEDQ